MLFLILVLVLLTQDFVKVITFVMFLLLLLYFSMLIASIRRYLNRRFTKECDELFTEEFYTRLNTTLNNEFK